MIFADNDQLVLALRARFPDQIILWARTGAVYYLLGPHDYSINKHIMENYLHVLEYLEANNIMPAQLIYLSDRSYPEEMNAEQIQAELQSTYYPMMSLTQALIQHKLKHDLPVLFINASKGEHASLFTSARSAFAKTMHLEQPHLLARVIELKNNSAAEILEHVLAELNQQEREVRYEHNQRLVKTYPEVLIPDAPKPVLFRKNGVYFITGGLGGLGLIFARFLAKNYQAKLVLSGRSVLNEEQKLLINELAKDGAQVWYSSVDVSKREDVERILTKIKTRYGQLNGIIHSAGVLRDAFIIKKTPQQSAEVIAPKISGSINLDELTKSEPLDFFVIFSSIAAVIGSVGQCDYAYANNFIDDFAQHRAQLCTQKQRQGKTIAINWPLWADGGMQIDADARVFIQKMLGAVSITTQEGVQAFIDALLVAHPQQIVIPGQSQKLQAFFAKTTAFTAAIKTAAPVADLDSGELQPKTLAYLKTLIATVLKLEPQKINNNEAFEHYGIDSIMTMKLNSALEENFAELPRTLFFEYDTLEALTQYFIDNHSAVLSKILGLNVQPYAVTQTYNEMKAPVLQRKKKTFKAKTAETGSESMVQNYKDTFIRFDNLNISLVRLGCDIDMEVIQAGQGEPVLLLCPWACIATAWRHQFDYLAKTHHVISIHYPGCGRSGFKPELMHEEKFADLIMETLSKIGINKSVNLVGWSMGGVIAQYIMNKYAPRIKKLVLVNSSAHLAAGPELKKSDIDRIMLTFEEDFTLSQQGLNGEHQLKMWQINGINSPEVQKYYYSQQPIFNAETLTPIKIPTLVIGGGRDHIMPVQDSEEFWKANKHMDVNILKSAGHYLPLFNPDYFNKLVKKFLKT